MPEITDDNDLVTQITTVKVPPDNQAEVLELMTERARFMATQPGFVSVSLHRSEDGSHIVNYVQWNVRRTRGGTSFAPVPQEVAAFRRADRGSGALPVRGRSHRGAA